MILAFLLHAFASEAQPEEIDEALVYGITSLKHLININRQLFIHDLARLLVILATGRRALTHLLNTIDCSVLCLR